MTISQARRVRGSQRAPAKPKYIFLLMPKITPISFHSQISDWCLYEPLWGTVPNHELLPGKQARGSIIGGHQCLPIFILRSCVSHWGRVNPWTQKRRGMGKQTSCRRFCLQTVSAASDKMRRRWICRLCAELGDEDRGKADGGCCSALTGLHELCSKLRSEAPGASHMEVQRLSEVVGIHSAPPPGNAEAHWEYQSRELVVSAAASQQEGPGFSYPGPGVVPCTLFPCGWV